MTTVLSGTDTCHDLVAEAFLVPAGVAADGTATDPVKPRRVSGFVESAFSPLVHAVVTRCLAGLTGEDGKLGDDGARTALVLVTTFGDQVTSDLGSRLLTSGQVQNPLLFYQSVPTTILGVVARDFGVTGPTMCVSRQSELRDDSLDLVDVLLADDEIDQVLLVAVDLAADLRARRVADELGDRPVPLSDHDTAVALLIRRGSALDPGERAVPVDGGRHAGFGAVAGLAELYRVAHTARTTSGPTVLTVGTTTAWGSRRLSLRLRKEAES